MPTLEEMLAPVGSLAIGIEPEAWRGLAAAGVNAVLSDYPLACRRALGE